MSQDKLEHLTAQVAEATRRVMAEGYDAVVGAAEEIFEIYESLYEIRWVQYRPYWNDGEPCHFQIQSDVTYVTADSSDELKQDPWEGASADGLLDEAVAKFEKLIRKIEDQLEQLFGDGVVVRIRREEVVCDDYPHD